METKRPVVTVEGRVIAIEALDKEFDTWVHTGRNIVIKQCSPDSELARQKLENQHVYSISRHIRGRAVLISNTGYQALRLLKDLFIQMNYILSIHVERSANEIREIISKEAQRDDNEYMDSFVVIIYGTPDGFDFSLIPQVLNNTNAPNLEGKPKLIYVIGEDTFVKQVTAISQTHRDPDFLLASTGFNGVMFYIYALCSFVHVLSAQEIWRLSLQFAEYHRFTASTHCTMVREFYFFPGLSASVMPNEIQNMDPRDVAQYLKILEEGKVSSYNIRLMFVGLYGAGKTCTARRMMGKEIHGVSSTDGIDVYIGKCKVDIRNETWSTVDDPAANMPYVKLSPLVYTDEASEQNIPDIKNLESMDDSSPAAPVTAGNTSTVFSPSSSVEMVEFEALGQELPRKRKRTEDYHSDANSMSSPASADHSFEMIPDYEHAISTPNSCESESENFQRNDQVDSFDTMRIAQRVIKDSRNVTGPRVKEALVSLWDFAGQFVYYATHQLFFSPRCIYLLVLNLDQNLDKTLNDWYFDMRGRQSIEAQGGVNFWLRSIYAYAQGAAPGIPPIFLVGTHKDRLPGDEYKRREIANKYFGDIRNLFQGSPLAYNISKTPFLLDNTMKDDEIERLKKEILNVSKTMPYWGEKVPAKWVELEQALDDRRREGKTFITLDEVKYIDSHLAKPIKDEKQLMLFLRAQHEMGNLIYFGDRSQLRNVVVLEPQWIIHAFRFLIGAKDFSSKYGPLSEQWEDFIETGKLNISLAENIWKLDTENRFFENYELLLQLLEKLDIIARASVLDQHGEVVQQLGFYYVPCLLKDTPSPGLLKGSLRNDCVSTPVLCFNFQDKFLPPAIFNRVVAICLGKWPVARQGKRRLLFCGCAVFEVSHAPGEDKHRMYIFSRKDKIGIRVERFTTRDARMVDPNTCDQVRRTVARAVNKEFTRFHTIQEGNNKPFKYQIQCKGTDDSDIMEDGLHDLDVLLGAIGADFFCSEHSDRDCPHSARPVEMLHEWFRDKIPLDFRLEGLSVLDTWIEKLPDTIKTRTVDERTLSTLSSALGKNWQFLMIRELNLMKATIDQIEENHPHRTRLQIFDALVAWFQKRLSAGQNPTYGLLLEAMKRCPDDVTIEWEHVQNVLDDLN